MAKKNNGGGGFDNLASKMFNSSRMQFIKAMREDEIFYILGNDIKEIMEQVSDNRAGKRKFPQYITAAFINPSTSKWFLDFVKEYKSELTELEVDALSTILCTAYFSELKNSFNMAPCDHAFVLDALLKAFNILNRKRLKKIKKLFPFDGGDMDKEEQKYSLRKLNLVSYPCPTPASTRSIVTLISQSRICESPKRLVRAVYKLFKLDDTRQAIMIEHDKRTKACNHPYYVSNGKSYFYHFMGSMLALNGVTNSAIDIMVEHFESLKKKDRLRILSYYADVHKTYPSSNVYLQTNAFMDKNRKLIKHLISVDIGYKKAFCIADMKEGMKKRVMKKQFHERR